MHCIAMIQFQNASNVYHMVVMIRCTLRCYNDDTYNLYEIKISVLDGFPRHATVTTNDSKILGRETYKGSHPVRKAQFF